MAKAAPVLISKCLELLIGDLMKSAGKVCKAKNAATINVNHLREAVAKENTFDFLQEVGVLKRSALCLLHVPGNHARGIKSRKHAE